MVGSFLSCRTTFDLFSSPSLLVFGSIIVKKEHIVVVVAELSSPKLFLLFSPDVTHLVDNEMCKSLKKSHTVLKEIRGKKESKNSFSHIDWSQCVSGLPIPARISYLILPSGVVVCEETQNSRRQQADT